MDVKVMPAGFNPRKRGRKPSFDIEPLLESLHRVVQGNEWVSFSMSKEDAASARRQLARMPYEVSLDNKPGADTATLFVRPL